MSSRKAKMVAFMFMAMLAAVLVAIACIRPETRLWICGIFAVPGFICVGCFFYAWLTAADQGYGIVRYKHSAERYSDY